MVLTKQDSFFLFLLSIALVHFITSSVTTVLSSLASILVSEKKMRIRLNNLPCALVPIET